MKGVPTFIGMFLIMCTPAILGMNILLVPYMGTSHIIELAALGEGLVSRGHRATIVVGDTFPKMELLHEVNLVVRTFEASQDDVQQYSDSFGDFVIEQLFMKESPLPFEIPLFTSGLALRDCRCMMEDRTLISQLQRENFDIAVVDGFALAYCAFLLPYTLNIPYAFTYSGLDYSMSYRNPALPSFVPTESNPFGPQMTFFQRMQCFIEAVSFEIYNPFMAFSDESLLREYAPEFTSWFDIMRKSVLFLIFKDHTLDFPSASMPNVIRTPGITVREGKALPSALEEVMTAAQDEVVLVSFGSLVGNLPERILRKQFDAFKRFPKLTFLMKVGKARFDEMNLSVPGNVIVKDWLPVQDILAHPKTRLFVTHGGNNGQWESVYHGVPMVCFPMFAEQEHNCERSAAKNVSLTLDIHSFTSDDLYQAIDAIISRDSFTKAAQFTSAVVRSRPMTSRDTAVYWLEHVNQFGGDHLRSVAMEMPLYQFLMLDVIGMCYLLLAVLFICLFILTRNIVERLPFY